MKKSFYEIVDQFTQDSDYSLYPSNKIYFGTIKNFTVTIKENNKKISLDEYKERKKIKKNIDFYRFFGLIVKYHDDCPRKEIFLDNSPIFTYVEEIKLLENRKEENNEMHHEIMEQFKAYIDKNFSLIEEEIKDIVIEEKNYIIKDSVLCCVSQRTSFNNTFITNVIVYNRKDNDEFLKIINYTPSYPLGIINKYIEYVNNSLNGYIEFNIEGNLDGFTEQKAVEPKFTINTFITKQIKLYDYKKYSYDKIQDLVYPKKANDDNKNEKEKEKLLFFDSDDDNDYQKEILFD